MEERLQKLIAAARTAWPKLEVPTDEFVSFLVDRLPAGSVGEDARAPDLYLACACRRGDPRAIAAFQETYFGEIDAAARRAGAGQAIGGDARQNLARILFTGASPAVGGYAGRGDLRGWIRVIAMREVLRLLARERRELPVASDSLLDALSPGSDPELAFLKEQHRQDFAEAFREAIFALSEHERTMFQRQVLDGWTLDDFAAHHGVHRATASRWLKAARATVLEETRARLKIRWGATTVEVDSAIGLLSSRFDVSVERVIRGG